MDHQAFITELGKVISSILDEENAELVDIHFIKAKGKPILRLLVDKIGGGVNLGDCARLNEKIGSTLEAQEIMQDGYILEVSSPGLDRPLKTKNDYLRCIDRKARIFLSEPIKGKMELEGFIKEVTQDSIFLHSQDGRIEVPLAKVIKAKQFIE